MMLLVLQSSILWDQAKDFGHINLLSFLPLRVSSKGIPAVNQLAQEPQAQALLLGNLMCLRLRNLNIIKKTNGNSKSEQ